MYYEGYCQYVVDETGEESYYFTKNVSRRRYISSVSV